MAGYLEQYGKGDEQREKIIKRVVILAVVLVVGGSLFYFFFHNYSEERQARQFFELLEAKNYQAAYQLWGCTTPQMRACHDYPFTEFMKDWSADSAPVNDAAVLDGESCGSGVIVEVDAGKAGDKKLWVERDTRILGFPPFDRCPQGNRIHDFWRNIRFRLHGRQIPPAGS